MDDLAGVYERMHAESLRLRREPHESPVRFAVLWPDVAGLCEEAMGTAEARIRPRLAKLKSWEDRPLIAVARNDTFAAVVRGECGRRANLEYLRVGRKVSEKDLLASRSKKYWHRDDGPARQQWESGGKVTASWFRDGMPFRANDEPTRVSVWVDSRHDYWEDDDGKSHRVDGPAEIWSGPFGTQSRWYWHGVHGRIGSPATIIERVEGDRVEAYYRDGLLHRVDGPAVVVYHRDGGRSETFVEFGRPTHCPGSDLPRRRIDRDGHATPQAIPEWVVPIHHDEWTDHGHPIADGDAFMLPVPVEIRNAW